MLVYDISISSIGKLISKYSKQWKVLSRICLQNFRPCFTVKTRTNTCRGHLWKFWTSTQQDWKHKFALGHLGSTLLDKGDFLRCLCRFTCCTRAWIWCWRCYPGPSVSSTLFTSCFRTDCKVVNVTPGIKRVNRWGGRWSSPGCCSMMDRSKAHWIRKRLLQEPVVPECNEEAPCMDGWCCYSHIAGGFPHHTWCLRRGKLKEVL